VGDIGMETDFQVSSERTKSQKLNYHTTRQWKGQRISALSLIFLGIWFIVEVLRHTQEDYSIVLAWAGSPWIGIALASLIGMVFYHSALGLQVVVEDYVRNSILQKILISQVKILSIIMTILSWVFIIRIAMIANE
jgi:succinate dehydrogenase / fumarate reductase membrane anchor subunit